jgi:hypothetical protein
MATITRLKAGQIVWDLQRNTAGNTTMKRDDLYEVKIIKVNLEENHVIASWNGNKPRRYNEREIKKWRVKEPVPKGKDIFGGDRY